MYILQVNYIMSLVRRCVIDESRCTQCHDYQEDVLHALWYCLNLSWDGDPQWNFRGQTSFGNFQQLLSHVLQSGCNVELFSMMVWTIWFRRNTIRVNPTDFPVDQVLQRAIESLLEFRVAQPRKQPTPPRPLAKWSPPVEDYHKVNFDGAIFKGEEKAGIGVTIRNCQGMVMASLSQKISLPQTVVELETLAATRALEFSIELGFSKVILEGDSETVIKALQDSSPSLAPFGLLIRDAQEAANIFTCISYLRVGRNGNSVAHNLARYARHITGFFCLDGRCSIPNSCSVSR